MSEGAITGFRALMRQRRKTKEKEESTAVKPVIREVSLSSIDERIRQLEQQLNDSDGDEFVDVDSDSISPEQAPKEFESQREKELVNKMKNALPEETVSLGTNEAYCELCRLKLSGDIEISTHIESSGHLLRLKVAFKNDLYISSHSPNTCTTCAVYFDSPESLMKHRDYRGHNKNATLKKRVCSCTLCNKQFTSGQQLAEHLKGKAHKEKLQYLTDKQAKFKRMKGGNNDTKDSKRRK